MAIDRRDRQDIKRLLQDEAVQERIKANMRRGREEFKITIGRASELFDMQPTKLRELDDLLDQERSSNKTAQRQYSLAQIDKIAIIRELLDDGYRVADIPQDLDQIWEEVSEQQRPREEKENQEAFLHINQRIEQARSELFLRYFASSVLRLSLALIGENLPNTTLGIVLPLASREQALPRIEKAEDLPLLGKSLVGWLSKSGSSHTLFTPRPSFQYASELTVLSLAEMQDERLLEEPKDDTYLILERPDKRYLSLSLDQPTVALIRRLLIPLYEDAGKLEHCFNAGMRDMLLPSTNLESEAHYRDIILQELSDMIIRQGGKTQDGQERWHFCCILLSNDRALPLQQQSLTVRAQSQLSPYKVGVTTISPRDSIVGMGIKAFQSGHVINQPAILTGNSEGSTIAFQESEKETRSAIAIPLMTQEGQALGAIYIASQFIDAFALDDQIVLRIAGRMIEELVLMYGIRLQRAEKLSTVVSRPDIVDLAFKEFLSEGIFLSDVETMLITMHRRLIRSEISLPENSKQQVNRTSIKKYDASSKDAVSFIGIDIDHQNKVFDMYGEQAARNLVREVGIRLLGHYRAAFTIPEERPIYHIRADRFYLMLKGLSLADARTRAEFLKTNLAGLYQVTLPGRVIEIPKITVRLAVSSYLYAKLEELLLRFPVEKAVASVRDSIMSLLDQMLNLGQKEGGNIIKTWDPETWDIITWPPGTGQIHTASEKEKA